MSAAVPPHAGALPVALVTGGVRGIGLACARELARRGYEVWVGWRSSEQRAARLSEEFGGRMLRADLADPSEAQRLADELARTRAGIDAWIHCAGDYHAGPLESTGAEVLAELWSSNVVTFHNTWRALRPRLRARAANGGARVLAFGAPGLAGLRARRDAAAYAAVKSALVVLVRSLAVEEAAHGVTFHVLSPGLVPHDAAHAQTLDPRMLERVPQRRAASPDEIARCAAWLLSDEARHATGSELVVSGGWML
ncbi:MAG: SDR family oxidoreductase [Planctomycetota bacterium]|nr:MAG: SDR family oxidoreductase [Planctomycetota bacterium]